MEHERFKQLLKQAEAKADRAARGKKGDAAYNAALTAARKVLRQAGPISPEFAQGIARGAAWDARAYDNPNGRKNMAKRRTPAQIRATKKLVAMNKARGNPARNPKKQRYQFWTDGGDENDILASSLHEAAEIASRKISLSEWEDGAWGWVKGPNGNQMKVPERTRSNPKKRARSKAARQMKRAGKAVAKWVRSGMPSQRNASRGNPDKPNNHYQVLYKQGGKWLLLTNTHAATSAEAISEARWDYPDLKHVPMKTWLLQRKNTGMPSQRGRGNPKRETWMTSAFSGKNSAWLRSNLKTEFDEARGLGWTKLKAVPRYPRGPGTNPEWDITGIPPANRWKPKRNPRKATLTLAQGKRLYELGRKAPKTAVAIKKNGKGCSIVTGKAARALGKKKRS